MDSDHRLPLYQRLRDQIAGDITRHVWRPGAAIPTEAELAETHKVAVGTVRKAIDLLVAEGLVERAQGRGTYVRRPSFDSSLFRFFRFQGPDGTRRVPESRILARERLAGPPEVTRALAIADGAEVIRLTRLRLIDRRPVLAEEIWLPADRFAPLMALEPNAFGDLLYPLYETHCRTAVASARETLWVETMAAPVATLLEQPPGTPAVAIERLALGYDERPVEWRRTRGPADQFRYQIEIR
ncbi:GntR family transcriptional regulator [Aliidongia dinghuensis]|uniref:GntR family transcriptional regulator n=1 Tax=Aliidongia dinghuensis TaxID=1867774 RepID=A0A8J3E4M0_9PROT|nr:GntR family transcriptional regulator [Aliidongia dinghuensis]GGF25309.1 GntR family transcriptional regulator [Aliidongia dinghuensis]